MTEIADHIKTEDGFSADRDLVAYLVRRNGRVTQYELRNRYGIKNPAQAINDAERQYGFELETGGSLPNGDVPYSLKAGTAPDISGTIPMFVPDQIEDTDGPAFVASLDLWLCRGCRRHPVYQPTGNTVVGYQGVCPRHGPMLFDRI